VVLNKQIYQYYYVLKEVKNAVSGVGWHCSIKQTTIFTNMDFWGTKTTERYDEYSKLTKEDCAEMVQTRKCLGSAMHCNNQFCESVDQLPKVDEYNYYWLQNHKSVYFTCEMFL
jgi:hypothetical protein